jgi:NAD(P)-dependent dehydrogenase (short-subunit alcohol dehydrogenase family)
VLRRASEQPWSRLFLRGLLRRRKLAEHHKIRRICPVGKAGIGRGRHWQEATAKKIVDTTTSRFKSVEVLVNNADIFIIRSFIDYTPEDFKALASTNLEGFIYISRLAIKQMPAQKTGGSIVSITGSLADHSIAGVNASVAMITKGGIQTVTRSLAMEYAKDGIRVNAVAPGVVDTPLHKNDSQDVLKSRSPLGRISDPQDIADAVLYLTEADQVTGEVLHVDGGAHVGKW